MSERKLRWGVISTANIGRAAVNPAIQASRNGALVAVASRDPAVAAEFAACHGIPRHFGSYEALLDDSEIEAVYIPLPNSLHREWAIKAAERGKHVLCEKPLALDAAECGEMAAAARGAGVKLMEAFMYRFHPRIGRASGLVRDGAIGELRVVRSAFTFRLTRPDNIRLSRELGGGALMDVGCYCVNVSRTVVGGEPVEAQAFARFGPSGVDLELAGTLRFENDVVAQLDCALSMERREHCEVAGTAGALTIESAFLPGTEPVEIVETHGRSPTVRHPIDGADQYRLMVEDFADAVLLDRPVRYPAAEAAANLRAIAALYRSARTGGAVVRV